MRLFISYRHEDSEGYIGALVLAMKKHFGGDLELFVDVDSTGLGADYVKVMLNAATSSDVVIACIGPKWRGASAKEARIFSAEDAVRRELREALSAGIPVFVALLQDAAQPQARKAEIPEDLFGLARAPSFALDDNPKRFEQDVVKMITDILRDVDAPQRAPAAVATLRVSAPPGVYWSSIELLVDDKSFGRFHPNKPSMFQLAPGAHKVQAKSDWFKSNALSVKAESGGTIDVIFTPGAMAWSMKLTLAGE